ncbi:MAG: NAD-dependent deacylase [Candidatus Sumerlaeia bacterium]
MQGEPYESAADRLRRARKVLVITGAGVSAESGIPTFRGADGLWRNYNGLDLATPEAFARDPVTVWEWYLWRRQKIASAAPNAAHRVLADWERRFEHFLIATQNVDRLHQAAGSRRIVEVHGNIWETRCVKTGTVYSRDEVSIDPAALPPRSPAGGLLRPNVVWFGEALPPEPLERIAAFFSDGRPDVTLIIGTTGVLMYIQSLVQTAHYEGSTLIEINPEKTALSSWVDIGLRSTACEALVRLDSMLEGNAAE